jgi:lipoate-protein ligase A
MYAPSRMPSLWLYREPDVRDARGLARRDRALLDASRAHGVGMAAIWRATRDAVALGRFHPVPEETRRAPDGPARRLSGGRAVPAGPGFVGLTLALPHRSALVGDAADALAPEQVLNRAVRGVLGALDALGVAARYPGRDLLTAGGRTIGAMAFEVAADGTTLIETTLAVERSFAVLPSLLERADPGGVVPVDMIAPDEATCVAALVGRAPDVDELADRIATGYRERLGIDCAAAPGAPPAAAVDADWLAAGVVPPRLDRVASARTMLGRVAAHLALADDGRIAGARLTGDLIAPSACIEALERALVGVPPEPATVRGLVAATFAAPGAFLLGADPLADVAATIVRAGAAPP